jgi:hypothetical protein
MIDHIKIFEKYGFREGKKCDECYKFAEHEGKQGAWENELCFGDLPLHFCCLSCEMEHKRRFGLDRV